MSFAGKDTTGENHITRVNHMRKTSTGCLVSFVGPGQDRHTHHAYTGDIQGETHLFRNKGGQWEGQNVRTEWAVEY